MRRHISKIYFAPRTQTARCVYSNQGVTCRISPGSRAGCGRCCSGAAGALVARRSAPSSQRRCAPHFPMHSSRAVVSARIVHLPAPRGSPRRRGRPTASFSGLSDRCPWMSCLVFCSRCVARACFGGAASMFSRRPQKILAALACREKVAS